jgi:hypothetical protein
MLTGLFLLFSFEGTKSSLENDGGVIARERGAGLWRTLELEGR